MRWEDERYVRVYTRDTPEWCLLSWDARGVFLMLLRAVDRAGLLHLGRSGPRAVAALLRAPLDAVERALVELVEDGCIEIRGDVLVVPNFQEAQEARASDAARARASRERARVEARVTDPSQNVTPSSQVVTERHDESHAVTTSHTPSLLAVPSCADPIRADPDHTLSAGARDVRPLAELGPDPSAPTVEPDLISLAQTLADEGSGLGRKVLERAAKGWRPTEPQLRALREIRDERAAARTPAPGRETSADEREIVSVYLEAQRRIRRETVPELALHSAAARRLQPDLARLIASISRDDWTPTPAEVAKHKLETYLRINDPRLAEQGYPLALLLARTDAADLPRPPRKPRERPAENHEPPRPMARYRGRPNWPAEGSAEEAGDIAAARMELDALRGAGGTST